MNAKNRPVDRAMKEERKEKQTIRSLWLEEVRSIANNYPESKEPWYLTLPGADGFDIQMLIEDGLIRITEVNSIAEEHQNKIVAVEKDSEAYLKLRKKYVGLPIMDVHFQELVAGDKPTAWPQKPEHKRYCRSRMVNLDLNSSLNFNVGDGGEIIFPVLEWISKLCRLHSYPSAINWTLCLTLCGDIQWPKNVIVFTEKFFKDNFDAEPDFRDSCENFWGEKLFDIVNDEKGSNIADLGQISQQKYLMVFVPKYIANLVHNSGWNVKTERNLRYGGHSDTAPMVSWIIKFEFDPDYIAVPNKLYRQSLQKILYQNGLINQNGEITSN